jgi:phospholipid/cholesterol/gamma-HCH transport system substrate-binding protein
VSQPRSSYAVGTGLFIVLGFAALAYLATQTSSVANVHQGDSYIVDTQFTNIGALKERAPVKIAGVRVGQVQSITLQPGHEVADVKLSIDKSYDKIPQDSVATIFTSGLLGDQYVGIQYGSAKQAVVAGGTLARTKSTEPLEEMLGKFFGAGNVVDNVGGSYTVKADFTNVGSLSVGAPVKMAGVVIGSVQSVRADPVKLNAQVVLAIDKRYDTIPDDSAAAVFTSGLIGTQYVAIQPGGSPDMLKDGDEMILTQSAMQLEDLIGKFLVNGSPSDKKDADTGKSSDTPAGKH